MFYNGSQGTIMNTQTIKKTLQNQSKQTKHTIINTHSNYYNNNIYIYTHKKTCNKHNKRRAVTLRVWSKYNKQTNNKKQQQQTNKKKQTNTQANEQTHTHTHTHTHEKQNKS